MKKYELRQLIKEEILEVMDYAGAARIYRAGDENVIRLQIGTEQWYMKKIDSTHFEMSNTKSMLGQGLAVHHIGQHRGEPYYDDVRSWLKGGPAPNGRTY